MKLRSLVVVMIAGFAICKAGAAFASPAPSAKLAPLADCAGAIAAMGHINPLAGGNDPKSRWFLAYADTLTLMIDVADPEVAQNAAVAREKVWQKQPQAAIAAKAEACNTQHR